MFCFLSEFRIPQERGAFVRGRYANLSHIPRQICAKSCLCFVSYDGAQNCRKFESRFRTICCKYSFSDIPFSKFLISELSGTGDSRESFAIDTRIFIARQADSPESLEFPIRANHATKSQNHRVVSQRALHGRGGFGGTLRGCGKAPRGFSMVLYSSGPMLVTVAMP